MTPDYPADGRYLEVGDGHRLYLEQWGASGGLPAVFLHGGPGSGCRPAQRALFDPDRHRVVFVDQRGAGRSTPAGALHANTTAHLVADLERLRAALGLEAWLVCGGSWGSLLALAYAQAHPQRVLGLVLRGIFLGSEAELWAYLDGPLRAFLPDAEQGDPLAAYARRILGPDPAEAVRRWIDHERALMGEPPLADAPGPERIAKARIQLHYLRQGCFLAPGQVLAGIDAIRHLPAAIVQGMADPVCPPVTAQALARAWPEAAWFPVPGAGHDGLSPPLVAAWHAALDRVTRQVAQRAATAHSTA